MTAPHVRNEVGDKMLRSTNETSALTARGNTPTARRAKPPAPKHPSGDRALDRDQGRADTLSTDQLIEIEGCTSGEVQPLLVCRTTAGT